MIREIKQYMTSDGQIFSDKDRAESWEAYLEKKAQNPELYSDANSYVYDATKDPFKSVTV